MKKNRTTDVCQVITIFVAIVLFVIPFFSYQGFSLGGDDSRLYYLYPKEYFRNYLFYIGTSNVLGGFIGYATLIFSAPVIGIILFVKTILPNINTQHLLYGFNLSLGFLFSYLFFRILDKTNKCTHIFAAILASCLYITSPYLVRTLFQSEFLVVYLITLTPFFFYTFTRGLEDKNMKYIVGCAVGVVLFGSLILSIPWFFPIFFVCFPYFIYCAFRHGFYFWKAIAVFVVASIGLHSFWLIHGLLSLISSRMDATLASVVASKQFIQNAENDMYSAMFLNGPVHQIVGYLRTSWQDHRPMPLWNFLGGITPVLIIMAGMKLKNATKHLQALFGVVLLSFCIAIFMITPNMGAWNMDAFLFLNRTIPMFSMFRNMSDKFGLAMAFVSAWGVFVSLVILMQSKHRIWKWISLGLGVIFLVYQIPLFLNAQGIGVKKPTITALSREYLQLVQYVSSLDTTKRFTWYPMTFPGYTPIQDEANKDAWYLGVSPLQALSGKSDVVGFYELQTNADPYRNWKMLELLKQKNFEEVVSILASYNIGYIITINEQLPDRVLKQLDFFSFVSVQTEEYKTKLLGKKIYDSGGLYSVYTINPEYSFDTAYLTNNPQDIDAPKEKVAVRQIKTNVYELTISPETDFQSLVLLTPYHVLWKVTLPKTGESSITLSNHRAAYEFGNVWDIQKNENFTKPVTCTIEFLPNRFVIPSVIVSVIVFFGCCVYICYPKKRL